MFFPQTPVQIIEFAAMIGLFVLGLSQAVRPGMWMKYYDSLQERGERGIVTAAGGMNLWLGIGIVSMHQVWSGAGLFLTIYGWALLAKSAVTLIVPHIGGFGPGWVRFEKKRNYVASGLMQIAISLTAAAALYL